MSLFQLETPFRKMAQNLRSPTASSFAAADWDQAFKAVGTTLEDDALLNTAKWIGQESAALLPHMAQLRVKQLPSSQSTILAVAAVNLEFIKVEDLQQKAIKHAGGEGAASLEFLAHQPIGGGPQGATTTAPGTVEAMIDAISSWLYDSSKNPTVPDATGDMESAAAEAMRAYTIRFGLNYLWNQALYEGSKLDEHDGKTYWLPFSKTRSTLIKAWQLRQESNLMGYPFIDMQRWAAASPSQRKRLLRQRTVVGVDSKGARRKIRIEQPSCLSKKPPKLFIERGQFEGSHLAQFMDSPFPSDPELNCWLLLRVWAVIDDLAAALQSRNGRSVGLDPDGARQIALSVSRLELINTICRSLVVSEQLADKLLDFLSYKPDRKKGNRGLWAHPIVQVPNEALFVLVRPVLAIGSTVRKVEAWLEQGGLDDSLTHSRGNQFESELRSSIATALTGNNLLSDAGSALNEIRKSKLFNEQVDLLIRVGELLFVCEVKFHLSAADSVEVFRLFGKLDAACSQATRKAGALSSRPDIIAKALSISEQRASQLRAIPLVVHNLGFGLGMEFGGCRITDAKFLQNLLTDGRLVTGGAMGPGAGNAATTTISLYRDQKEAVANMERLLDKPPILDRFIERIEWSELPFPTSSTILLIEVPLVGEVRGSELLQAMALEAELSSL